MRLDEWDGRPPDRPDGWSGLVPVGPGDVDGDDDGVPDTVVVSRARGGAWVFTDTDTDGFADRVLDLDPDRWSEDGFATDDTPGVLDVLSRWWSGWSGRP